MPETPNPTLPLVEEMIEARDLRGLRRLLTGLPVQEVAALIDELPAADDAVAFRLLPQEPATDVFEYLSRDKQKAIVDAMADEGGRLAVLLNDLSPDERTALLEELPGPAAQRLLGLLSPRERRVAVTLLGYPEDSVGRLMTTDYVAVRPEWTARQALDHIRRYGKDSETLNVLYVVDAGWHLLDDLRLRELLLADPDTVVGDLMDRRFVALAARDDQETAVGVFRDYDRVALPVTDGAGVLLGIVTIDDVLDVAEEEATEDIHKIGGSEALEDPYLATPLATLVQKRAKWLVVLFLGEMLTASAMGHFENEIRQAVVLALFVPLIISSGGNSGSQAATLIIRALAVGELRLGDWWRVMRREVLSGLALGGILGDDRRGAGGGLGADLPHLRPALAVGRRHRRPGAGRGGRLGHPLGLDAPPGAAPPRRRPRHLVGPLRRHPGRRHRPGDLLLGRRRAAARAAVVGGGPARAGALSGRRPWRPAPRNRPTRGRRSSGPCTAARPPTSPHRGTGGRDRAAPRR